jgi:hypothetical protein
MKYTRENVEKHNRKTALAVEALQSETANMMGEVMEPCEWCKWLHAICTHKKEYYFCSTHLFRLYERAE